VLERSPHHPKVEGLNLPTVAGTGREDSKKAEKTQFGARGGS
jgi:hypothetical protein